MWRKLKTTIIPQTDGQVFPTMNDSDTTMLSTTVSMNSLYNTSELNNDNYPKRILSPVSTADNNDGTISFHNINYVIGATKDSDKSCSKYRFHPCVKPAKTKQILFNLTGKFTKGLHAILGPTGCGKSSLLDVLAGRKDPRDVFGNIFINGLPRCSLSKYTVGYVVQENVLCNTLTVRENLSFSANLRLPQSVSASEKQERIRSVICELGLKYCADVHIGTEFLRGISGGEKKRTCIGMELVLSPKILLVDEPTTGLDAATAKNVMDCLKELAQQGRTIVFTIHQPRYSIFKLFDTAMFMCEGQCVFHGPTKDIIPYFTEQGYECELHNNPADFVLDILINTNQKPDIFTKLADAYVESSTHKELIKSIGNEQTQNIHEGLTHVRRPSIFESLKSMRKEIWYISKRTLLNSARSPTMTLSQIANALIIGLLVGFVFHDLARTIDPGIENRRGALFFIVIRQVSAGFAALEPFIIERALFIHEYVSGYYRISSFFLAKLICDVFMRIITSILFAVIAYPMTGLVQTTHQFLIFLLTIFMATMFGQAISFFTAATTSNLGLAITVVSIVLTIMMIFMGFLIDLASISKWISWIRWISAFYYGYNLVLINEFHGLEFCLANMSNICPVTGDDVLDRCHIDHTSSWDLWKYFLALTLMTMGFLILAYIQLLRIRKTK